MMIKEKTQVEVNAVKHTVQSFKIRPFYLSVLSIVLKFVRMIVNPSTNLLKLCRQSGSGC